MGLGEDVKALASSRAGGLLGTRVLRASATLPQTAAGNLFTIQNGVVLVTYIVGEVTVVMGAVGNNTSLQHSVGPTALCAVLNTANNAVGTLYHITGDPAEPLRGNAACMPGGMRGGIAAGAGLIANGVLCNPGNIQLLCAANNTGQCQWTLFFIPIDPEANVVPA
jgi:hypothetical protein